MSKARLLTLVLLALSLLPALPAGALQLLVYESYSASASAFFVLDATGSRKLMSLPSYASPHTLVAPDKLMYQLSYLPTSWRWFELDLDSLRARPLFSPAAFGPEQWAWVLPFRRADGSYLAELHFPVQEHPFRQKLNLLRLEPGREPVVQAERPNLLHGIGLAGGVAYLLSPAIMQATPDWAQAADTVWYQPDVGPARRLARYGRIADLHPAGDGILISCHANEQAPWELHLLGLDGSDRLLFTFAGSLPQWGPRLISWAGVPWIVFVPDSSLGGRLTAGQSVRLRLPEGRPEPWLPADELLLESGRGVPGLLVSYHAGAQGGPYSLAAQDVTTGRELGRFRCTGNCPYPTRAMVLRP